MELRGIPPASAGRLPTPGARPSSPSGLQDRVTLAGSPDPAHALSQAERLLDRPKERLALLESAAGFEPDPSLSDSHRAGRACARLCEALPEGGRHERLRAVFQALDKRPAEALAMLQPDRQQPAGDEALGHALASFARDFGASVGNRAFNWSQNLAAHPGIRRIFLRDVLEGLGAPAPGEDRPGLLEAAVLHAEVPHQDGAPADRAKAAAERTLDLARGRSPDFLQESLRLLREVRRPLWEDPMHDVTGLALSRCDGPRNTPAVAAAGLTALEAQAAGPGSTLRSWFRLCADRAGRLFPAAEWERALYLETTVRLMERYCESLAWREGADHFGTGLRESERHWDRMKLERLQRCLVEADRKLDLDDRRLAPEDRPVGEIRREGERVRVGDVVLDLGPGREPSASGG